jgi:hypothetical protein
LVPMQRPMEETVLQKTFPYQMDADTKRNFNLL